MSLRPSIAVVGAGSRAMGVLGAEPVGSSRSGRRFPFRAVGCAKRPDERRFRHCATSGHVEIANGHLW